MNVNFTFTGLAEVQTRLRELGDGMAHASHLTAIVGTDVRYAKFVHDGTRFMHARPFLTNALDTKRGAIEHRIDQAVGAVAHGGDVGQLAAAFQAAGLDVQAEAQRNTPVKTGNLRRSEHTEVFSR